MSVQYQLKIKAITSFGLMGVGLIAFCLMAPIYLPENFGFIPTIFSQVTVPVKIFGPIIFILSIVCIIYGLWLSSFGRIKIKIEGQVLFHRDAIFWRRVPIENIQKWEYLDVSNSHKKQLILFLSDKKVSIDITYCDYDHEKLVNVLGAP